MLIILGKKDTTVSNKVSRKIYKELRRDEDNLVSMQEFENMDHSPFSDGLIYKEITKLIDVWFDKSTAAHNNHH